MESSNKLPRGWRKENIPPALESYLIPEQGNVQKNINVKLYLSPGNPVAGSRHQAGSAIPGFHHTGETTHGRPRAASMRNRPAGPQPQNRVQTNLACPYWPLRDTTADPASWRQSNLESKRHRMEPLGDPGSLPAARSSCPGGSRKKPPSERPGRSSAFPRAERSTSKERRGHEGRQVRTQPIGSVSGPGRPNLEADGRSFSPVDLLGVSYLGCLHPEGQPSFTSPSRSLESIPPGPPLTIDHLKSSPLAERGVSSTLLRTLLESSQTSADLYSSIQRLRQEIAVMGALGSFPWESKSLSLAYRPPADPPASTSTVLSLMEQLTPKQASVNWGTPLSQAWDSSFTRGTGRDREPLPIAYDKVGVYGPPGEEASDRGWPPGVCSSVGPTTPAFQGEEREERYCGTSFRYLRSCSGAQRALEEESLCRCPKPSGHQRALAAQEPTAGVLHRSDLGLGDLPLGLLSTDGLQVSLKTCTKAPLSMGVCVYDAQQAVHLTVHSPGGPAVTPAHELGKGSEELHAREAGEACRASFIASNVDEQTRCSPFGAAAKNGPREYSQGAKPLARECVQDLLSPACCDHSPGVERGQREPPCHWEKDGGREILRGESLEADDGSMEKKKDRPLPERRDPLLVKSFAAWREHVFGKLAVARAQHERQLLRKGLSALQWAVQLRNAQVAVTQRSHATTVLANVFRRWQDAAAKRREARALRQRETMTGARELLPPPERITKLPAWCQLSAEQVEDAARYRRAEGLLWMQLRHTQGAEELNRKMEAVREMRRLAAFRLWRLRTERLDQEEARAQDARAALEKARLAAAFATWRARCQASRRIVPLAARIQRGLISRCFAAWRSFAERQVRSWHSQECRRARALRLCFRQWALMVRSREQTRWTLLQLLALRQRKADARFGPAAHAGEARPGWSVASWSQRNGAESLEALFGALTLQEAFQAWKARWRESLAATAFQRVQARRRLEEALARWHWKSLCLHPPGPGSRDLAEDRLLVSLESSLSSGFHSNPAAPPVSTDSSAKDERQLLARCFALWSSGTRQALQAQQHLRHSLLARAFLSWAEIAARNSARLEALVEFERAGRQRLLASCFRRWKTAFSKAVQEEEERSRRRPAGCRAVWRWRKATRAYLALRSISVHQACNFWTKAANFRQCIRKQSSLAGARKHRKMPLLWPSRQRQNREETLGRGLSAPSRLISSSFRVWLMAYRSQNGARRPPGSLDAAGRIAGYSQAQKSGTELAAARGDQLGRKYLSLWRGHVLVRHSQAARDARCLGRAWQAWKAACRTRTLPQALAKHRLVEWCWKTWRRRCLQSWAAERFQEAEEKRLLRKAFARWQQVATVSHASRGSICEKSLKDSELFFEEQGDPCSQEK
ncbi:uncharacterized protein C1orf167 homolog isoform X2 [Varanus komodoensis]|uniref:uncharacterized protein C1orf167 homolog isoform X2 n=1 Tax=Varanus komodoensis TaxID=61221 RepID=UPI001CF798CC|nr:uncharacterized protein C1orf167 homolog isoform X2 [Varanus komodoensis]